MINVSDPLLNRLTVDGNGAEIFWPMLGAAVKTAQSVSDLSSPGLGLIYSSVFTGMELLSGCRNMKLPREDKFGGRWS